jgi:hypothetical protein
MGEFGSFSLTQNKIILYSKGKKTQKESLAHVFGQDMSNGIFKLLWRCWGGMEGAWKISRFS